jgi:HD-like signal output (HDOD) protein
MDSILLKSYQAPRVPVSYQIWLQLVTKLEKDAGMDEIAELVNQDPGLVIKVLSVANSAFIGAGSGNEVSSVESALMRLGSNEIVRIVGMLAFQDTTTEGLPLYCLTQAEHIRHSVATAMLMAHFASHTSLTEGEAYTLGMICGMGRWFLQKTIRSQNIPLRPYSGPLLESFNWEEDVLHINHAEFASNTMRAFKLPRNLLDPLTYYVRPMNSPNPTSSGMLLHCSEQATREQLPSRASTNNLVAADWFLRYDTREQYAEFQQKSAMVLVSLGV